MTRDYNSWELPTKLLLSIRNADLELCRELLQNEGADVDQTFKINNQTKSAIHVAVELSLINFVELLIEFGCSVDRRDSNGKTALHVAIEMGYDNIANLLLLHKADINLPDVTGQSPLHFAAERNSINIAKKLIEMGADVSRRNSSGFTPLLSSHVSGSSYEMLRVLLDGGARADDLDDLGRGILWHMLIWDRYEYETLELLIRNGARPEHGGTWAPIHLVMNSRSDKKYKCLELMLKSGCDINIGTGENHTLLHLAVQIRDIKFVKMLLRAGANPNIIDRLGAVPLSYILYPARTAHCSSSVRRKLVSLLINGGARMSLSEFDAVDSPYFNADELQCIRRKLSNPMTLMEQCRIAVWKALGTRSFDWLEEATDLIPSTLISYLQLELD